MLEIHSLTKVYGNFCAVHPFSLSVKPGEIFGFLGENGSGKTTTIRMLMGILVPSGGSVSIFQKNRLSHHVWIQSQIGYLPENPIFYDYLKGREVLEFVGEMHGQSARSASKNAIALLEEFDLHQAQEEYAIHYSMGMKKKLGLACALIHEPKLLILDEPSNGLDPRMSKNIQARLKKFVSAGGSIFMSTHGLHMAETLCDRVGVLHHGKLIALGTLEELKKQAAGIDNLEEIFLKLTES